MFHRIFSVHAPPAVAGGDSSKTVPTSLAPPLVVVPYRLPCASSIKVEWGKLPVASVPPALKLNSTLSISMANAWLRAVTLTSASVSSRLK
jgi:hypothetical protein